MKLQTKLFVVLVTGLLAVYLGSCLVQRHFAVALVGQFSRSSKAGELERHWQWVDCVQQTMATSLEGVMATGDMDLFEKVIHEQAKLPGLQEAALTDFKGHVVYTTVPARLHGELPAELKSQLLNRAELAKLRTGGAFEIYQPLRAEKNCISCHTERHQGDVLGVLSLRFSDQALKAAEQSWDQFHGDFSRANALTAIVTTGVLIVLLAVLVGLCVHFFLSRPLERTAGDLAQQSQQVRLAAGHVTGTSQSLAEGAGELAASLEETSAALAQLTATTANNTEHANQATEIARLTHAAAENGVRQMTALDSTINEINASSADISKINKIINEIAFQTNLLALNAAVEAARAGEAGLGFAVVAEEVRNLARRSADAATETAAKIEGAIGKTAQGVIISRQVAAALNDIVNKAGQVDRLASEVAGASREQTSGITQINSAIAQMDRVTQNNAAHAEETATAAEELNAQAEMMKQDVGHLLHMIGKAQPAEAEPANHFEHQAEAPAAGDEEPVISSVKRNDSASLVGADKNF